MSSKIQIWGWKSPFLPFLRGIKFQAPRSLIRRMWEISCCLSENCYSVLSLTCYPPLLNAAAVTVLAILAGFFSNYDTKYRFHQHIWDQRKLQACKYGVTDWVHIRALYRSVSEGGSGRLSTGEGFRGGGETERSRAVPQTDVDAKWRKSDLSLFHQRQRVRTMAASL